MPVAVPDRRRRFEVYASRVTDAGLVDVPVFVVRAETATVAEQVARSILPGHVVLTVKQDPLEGAAQSAAGFIAEQRWPERTDGGMVLRLLRSVLE